MSSKERELDFGDYESSFVKKQTRRETFLAEMEEVVPFSELIRMIEPFYPRVGLQGGRPPYRLEVMLRIHLIQNWNSLSDEAMENDLAAMWMIANHWSAWSAHCGARYSLIRATSANPP